ncbi:hypothetical protein RHGRI_029945 [Rhododendron griersonianum]|uniref:Uncharacterized protein n=1 Tax=Rhododendron griersonianum TaxID=479676 RepID=A0AAV6IPA2_9ERIC|nr:hypothetical protein RHGRI_029945 [Rhododendron griersonianum]
MCMFSNGLIPGAATSKITYPFLKPMECKIVHLHKEQTTIISIRLQFISTRCKCPHPCTFFAHRCNVPPT